LLEGLPELGIEAHAFVSQGLQSLSIVDQFQKGHSGGPIPSVPPVRRDERIGLALRRFRAKPTCPNRCACRFEGAGDRAHDVERCPVLVQLTN
jgi:hypothetical protein